MPVVRNPLTGSYYNLAYLRHAFDNDDGTFTLSFGPDLGIFTVDQETMEETLELWGDQGYLTPPPLLQRITGTDETTQDVIVNPGLISSSPQKNGRGFHLDTLSNRFSKLLITEDSATKVVSVRSNHNNWPTLPVNIPSVYGS